MEGKFNTVTLSSTITYDAVLVIQFNYESYTILCASLTRCFASYILVYIYIYILFFHDSMTIDFKSGLALLAIIYCIYTYVNLVPSAKSKAQM